MSAGVLSHFTVKFSGAFSFFLAVLLLFGIDQAFSCTSDGRYLMGTVLEITLCNRHDRASQSLEKTTEDLFSATAHLEALLSTFSPQSVISFLNTHAGQGVYSVSPEVFTLLSLSHQYWKRTQGTFDITIGSLMKIWEQAGKTQTLPSPQMLQQARQYIGGDKIILLPNNRVRLAYKGMAINLGGIGKGFALDQLLLILKDQQITNALLDFGQSSIWALGVPPDAQSWRLLIQRPDGQEVGVIELRDQALSVSASFGQSFILQGQQYGHIIDPRNGMPLQRELLACVVAPTATEAEALSKALLILGEEDGIALLERLPQREGFLSEANGRQWMTTGWRFQNFKNK